LPLFRLQNWTFVNARRLVNSYVYTYRLPLAANLYEAMKKRERTTLNSSISDIYSSQGPYLNHFVSNSKADLISTGEDGFKQSSSHPTSSRKGDSQRPASLSDFSSGSKRSEL
jgi:hypothetical protein